ncbi:SDR family NAD(P)-dependent oxidoreductase [Chryseolinea lacunae]|uniref:SDR family oxidoreductase n=1 Tax=Chryseolinea lacunae TaxID=2801331 RepID=A0ABS1L1L2_9BACT|nr:SDR family oxidoreductase [Chryseolinea lacunae]MBL0745333.1 SDR family oxidoreductase [Chryseolinea lacunae]
MKHAIVTGASKGLGKALAQAMAARGYDVLLVARSEALLEQLASEITQQHPVKAHCLALDLALPVSADQIAAWCADRGFQPSVLINNAGFACWGYFEKLSLALQLQMLNLHVQGMVALTHQLLPALRKHEQAYVLNVSSTTAYQAVPTLSLYAASKTFVRSFSRGLRYELRNSPVSVTCLSPGPMSTNFIAEANMHAMQQTAAKFEMTADEVARRGVKAMFNRRAEVIPGWMNRLTVVLSKVVPDALLERIASNLYQSKLS